MKKKEPARSKKSDQTTRREERAIALPKLKYLPPKPRRYRPAIGMIGCGGITGQHLAAYVKMGYRVVAFCDVNEEAARRRQAEFYPEADVYTDHRALLERADIDVVDVATHPAVRGPQLADALAAGKHVLSQKPFVLDLDYGARLVDLARRAKVKLAVNQNGRWAPYFSYLRGLVKAGLLGEIASVNMNLAWDHTWIRGTAFERLEHVILYDFAIHWYDMVACVFGRRPALSVYAEATRVAGQSIAPPMSAHAAIRYEGGLATLAFHAHAKQANSEALQVTGSEGVYTATGKVTAANQVVLQTAKGRAAGELAGSWFPDGMAGAMGELLCAIEEDREPENSALNNLGSLALCFAGLQSARTGKPVVPGRALNAGPGCSTE